MNPVFEVRLLKLDTQNLTVPAAVQILSLSKDLDSWKQAATFDC